MCLQDASGEPPDETPIRHWFASDIPPMCLSDVLRKYLPIESASPREILLVTGITEFPNSFRSAKFLTVSRLNSE